MSLDQLPSSSTPTTINVTCPTTGTEKSQILVTYGQPTLKKILIKSRSDNDLKFQWQSTTVIGLRYVTIPAGQTYWDDGLDKPEATIYLIPTIDGQIAEIQIWQ